MKILTKHIILLFTILILFGCGGNKDDDQSITPLDENPIETTNSAPSIPVLIYPSDGLLCIENQLEFAWEASLDAEGDLISYSVQVANDEQFTNVTSETVSNEIKTVITLEKGKTLFWRVRATDDKNNESSYTPSWKFYTEGEPVVNQLPFPTELINPAVNEIIPISSNQLSWNGSDPDGDILTYDVYFGTISNPPLVFENLNTNSYEASLTTNTVYYWRIITKDGAGGTNIGPIWSFRTK